MTRNTKSAQEGESRPGLPEQTTMPEAAIAVVTALLPFEDYQKRRILRAALALMDLDIHAKEERY